MYEALTGIGVKLQGHLKIVEYANRTDYLENRPSRTLLNKRNAIHKDNVAILTVKAMMNRPLGQIAYMFFGNGGTTLNSSGTCVMLPPNDTGLNANLYNPIFFQLVDDTLGALPGNQMGIRHISGTRFTDSDIRCLIGVNEPFGQHGSNTDANINLNQDTFSFDEIGLKTIDGTLITHVIFSPVLKTASSILEVIYTIRVAIDQPPPPPIVVSLIGQQSQSSIGSMNGAFVACLTTFNYSSSYVEDNFQTYDASTVATQLDIYGNYFVKTNTSALIFDPSGTVISSRSCTDLADALDTFHGSAIVGRGAGFSSGAGFQQTPILDGQYILAFLPASNAPDISFARWFVILQPNAVGDPTILGTIWFEGFNEFRFAGTVLNTGISNGGTIDDPILIRGSDDGSGSTFQISVIPSIADIIGGTYDTGWPTLQNPGPYKVPKILFEPVSSSNLSSNLLVETQGSNINLNGGFALPDDAGGCNFYIYLSRCYMDFNIGGGVNSCPEVTNVIQPAYPLGAMLRIKIPTLDYDTLAAAVVTAHGGPGFSTGGIFGATATYTIDNANWIDDSATPQIPFDDEYTYLSNSLSGGQDVYTTQPGTIINRGGGKWWIFMYMPGLTDYNDNTHDSLYESIRIFEYDASTQVATQIFRHTCIGYTLANIPFDSHGLSDYQQTLSISSVGSTITIHINGIINNIIFQKNYSNDFCEFSIF